MRWINILEAQFCLNCYQRSPADSNMNIKKKKGSNNHSTKTISLDDTKKTLIYMKKTLQASRLTQSAQLTVMSRLEVSCRSGIETVRVPLTAVKLHSNKNNWDSSDLHCYKLSCLLTTCSNKFLFPCVFTSFNKYQQQIETYRKNHEKKNLKKLLRYSTKHRCIRSTWAGLKENFGVHYKGAELFAACWLAKVGPLV